MWTLEDLFEHADSNQAEINGKWVPARPLRGGWFDRLRQAWAVLTDRADAFTWPEQPPALTRTFLTKEKD